MTRNTTFLRRALAADAIVTGVAAAQMLFGAGLLTGLLGLPEPLLRYAGLSLIPFVAIVGYLATRESPSRAAVWGVIAYNVLWAVDSMLLLVSGYVAPTALGYAFVIAQASAVAVFAQLEYVGLKRAAAVEA
jgi:hypothetical protein